MNEPYLAGLADALAVCESFPAEEGGRFEDVLEGAEVQHQADGGGASSTLTWIAMYDDNVFRVTCKNELID